jgi:hypothetical protein
MLEILKRRLTEYADWRKSNADDKEYCNFWYGEACGMVELAKELHPELTEEIDGIYNKYFRGIDK